MYNYYGTSTDVVIPKEVTSIGSSAFCNCAKLNSVVISDSVTSIGSGAFCECSSLTSVVIPNSVTIIEEDVFEECSNLRDITIPTSLAKQLPNRHSTPSSSTLRTLRMSARNTGPALRRVSPRMAATAPTRTEKNTASTSNPTPRSWSNWPPSILPCST